MIFFGKKKQKIKNKIYSGDLEIPVTYLFH